MWGTRSDPITIALEHLPEDVRQVVEEMLISGRGVPLTRDGETVAVLATAPSAMEGVVLPAERERVVVGHPEGVAVVATAMRLNAAARERLSQELGDGYLVLDLLEAPESADVLLTHPVSPQLLGRLRSMFPQARVIVAEIDDAELGVSYTGPVARLMDAGAEAYLPPRPVERVGQELGAYLAGTSGPALTRGGPDVPQIEAPSERP